MVNLCHSREGFLVNSMTGGSYIFESRVSLDPGSKVGTSAPFRKAFLVLSQGGAESFDLLNQVLYFEIVAPAFKRFAYNGDNIRYVERLGDEIPGSEADRFLGIVQGPVPGNDHDLDIGLKFLDFF